MNGGSVSSPPARDEQPARDAARRALDTLGAAGRSRVLASMARRFGDLDLAEDAVQEALIEALQSWQRSGVPRSPEAWLRTVAKRKAIDVVRRDRVLAEKLARLRIEEERTPLREDAADPQDVFDSAGDPVIAPVIADDRLVLLFTCAHPALRQEDRIALMLRYVLGLSTTEVAHALLLPTSTLQQRLVRAKARIRTWGIPFQAPDPHESPSRLRGVFRAVALLYTEGFARSTGTIHVDDDLTAEAIALARVLAELLPSTAEASGLLALLLLTEARRPARTDSAGEPVPLAQQDRALWDRMLVDEGIALAKEAAGSPEPGTYAIQAAIAAVHAETAVETPTASSDSNAADRTDWPQIAVLYRMLEAHEPGPVVRLGRAIALGKVHGPHTGARLLETIADDPALDRFRPFHIARGLTLEEVGDASGAASAYKRALSLPGNTAEDDFLVSTLAGIDVELSRPQP